jgi:GTPase SAR1 family protein
MEWFFGWSGKSMFYTIERQVTTREGKMFAESNGLRYIETSAKSGQNVEEAFLIIARDIHKLLQDGRLNVEEGWDGVKHGFSRPPKEQRIILESKSEMSKWFIHH